MVHAWARLAANDLFVQAPFMGVIIGPRGVNHKRLQDLAAHSRIVRALGLDCFFSNGFATANTTTYPFCGAKLFFGDPLPVYRNQEGEPRLSILLRFMEFVSPFVSVS